MARHQKNHSRASLKCKICEKTFTVRDSLRQHDKTHWKPEDIQCPSIFHSSSALRKHVMRIHEKIKFLCPYCQKSFSTDEYCKKHITTCRHSKPEKCSVCDKLVKNSSTLQEHMKSHIELECYFWDLGILLWLSVLKNTLKSGWKWMLYGRMSVMWTSICQTDTQLMKRLRNLHKNVTSFVNSFLCFFPGRI